VIGKYRACVGLALLLPFTGILYLNASYYLPFFSDDSLISLRYVSRFLAGDGLTWTDGQPVEGYSNLLWVLLTAALGALGVELVAAARILGFLGMTVIMFAVSQTYLGRTEFRVAWLPITIALLFLSIAAPIAVWAIGGLEQPLYGALIAVSIMLMHFIIDAEDTPRKTLICLSLVLGLLCLTRPDGPIYTVASAASIFFVGRFCGKAKLIPAAFFVLIVPALFYLGQLAFRIYYYGEFVPNTALVKLTPSLHHLWNGFVYIKDGLLALFPFSLIAVVALFYMVYLPEQRAKSIYPLAILFMWGGYLAVIGGDIFPAYRHFIPLVVVFAFSLAEAARFFADKLLKQPNLKPFCVLVTISILLFIPFTVVQFTDAHNQRAKEQRWEWDGRDLALVLKGAFSEQRPLMAVTAAGTLPYWSEFPSLDMLGLNDYYLPRNPPELIGTGMLGHELGDGQYVLDSNPDIIVFNTGTKPSFRSGEELKEMPEFHRRFSPVDIWLSQSFQSTVYFNKYSEKIGIKESLSEISVPGFLFKNANSNVYQRDDEKLVAKVATDAPVTATFESAHVSDLTVNIISSDAQKLSSALKREGDELSITISSASIEPVEIEEVILRKAEPPTNTGPL